MAARALVAAINWNGARIIGPMLESLMPQVEQSGCRLLVFDNASEDGSDLQAQRAFTDTPWAQVVQSPKNLGFGEAANTIVMGAEEPVVVLANTDTVFRPGALENLLACMERRPHVGVAGPRLLWPSGDLQPSQRDFPFPGKLVVEHLPLLRRLSARYSPHRRGRAVDWLVGAVTAVRSEAFREVGGFSPSFAFFHEETDLHFRLAGAGWTVWFEPSSEVVHLGSVSSRKRYGDDITLRYIPEKIRFLRLHGYPLSPTLFGVLMSGLHIFRWAAGLGRSSLALRDPRYRAEYCRCALRLLWERAPGTRE